MSFLNQSKSAEKIPHSIIENRSIVERCFKHLNFFSTGSQDNSSSEITTTALEPRLLLTLKGPASLTVPIFIS